MVPSSGNWKIPKAKFKKYFRIQEITFWIYVE